MDSKNKQQTLTAGSCVTEAQTPRGVGVGVGMGVHRVPSPPSIRETHNQKVSTNTNKRCNTTPNSLMPL